MMKKKSFPLRIHSDILEAMQKWANDDLRSINAQIEFILRESLARAGRLDQSLYNTSAQERERED
ncbi:MAG: Arc family DNA-binding protein [Pseudomonadota bacterium]|nr:Arc family DNA-binding protein [Pseudomonadota bacterium]